MTISNGRVRAIGALLGLCLGVGHAALATADTKAFVGARIFDGTGQLIAVVADSARPDNQAEVAISRPKVPQADVERALDGWEQWATVLDDNTYCPINLATICDPVHRSRSRLTAHPNSPARASGAGITRLNAQLLD